MLYDFNGWKVRWRRRQARLGAQGTEFCGVLHNSTRGLPDATIRHGLLTPHREQHLDLLKASVIWALSDGPAQTERAIASLLAASLLNKGRFGHGSYGPGGYPCVSVCDGAAIYGRSFWPGQGGAVASFNQLRSIRVPVFGLSVIPLVLLLTVVAAVGVAGGRNRGFDRVDAAFRRASRIRARVAERSLAAQSAVQQYELTGSQRVRCHSK